MNRTLLLIICDFLLLNLLALTRWEKVEPVPTQQPPVPTLQGNMTVRPAQDLVEVMKLALEDEQASRAQLQQQLESARSTAAQRAESLAELQQARSQLEARLSLSREKLDELARQSAAAALTASNAQTQVEQLRSSLTTRQSELEKQRLLLTKQEEKDLVQEQMKRQLQEALAEKEAEVERQKNALSYAEQERNAALLQASKFASAVKVAETERNLLRENVDHLKGEVAIVRQEKEKLNAQTEELSGGVTQLAARTGELVEEVRGSHPVNMNVMFNDFLSNRVDVTLSAMGPGFFGTTLRQEESKTVLVRDGAGTYAPVHVSEAPFTIMIPATGMSAVSGDVTHEGRRLARGGVQFWATDPRVLMVPVTLPPAEADRVKTYEIAANPFKFTEAVLISRGGKYYGEVEFKLDARTPHYVRMKNRLFSRVFGEFSPSTGDLVLSKTGEFLGIMINSDYCAVVKDFNSHTGDRFDEATDPPRMRSKLEELRRRIDVLPFALR